MKKWLCAVMAAMMLLATCASAEVLYNGQEYPISSEPIELSFYVATTNTGCAEPTDDQFAIHSMEELTGVHINWEFVTGSSDQIAQRTNLKFAGSTLPDVFVANLSKSMQMQYGDAGLIIPLNDLIDQYAVNIKQVFEDMPDVREAFTAPDGNIYGLGSVNQFYHGVYPCKMWVNKTWLDKLGLAIPETTEEFKQMLIAFRDQDPNGNGIADEIPLAAHGDHLFTYLMNAFIYTAPGSDAWANNPGLCYVEDGKIVFIGDKEAFREGLAYINDLFNEGLIATDTLSMDSTQLKALGMAETPILGAASELFAGEFTTGRNKGDRYWDYISIPPLAGPEGVRQAPERLFTFSGSQFSISKDCKNPEAAIRWIDYLFSLEGTASMTYGKYYEEYDKNLTGWTWGKEGEVGADGNPAVWMRFMSVLPADDPNYPKTEGWGQSVLPMYIPLWAHTGQTIMQKEYNNDMWLYSQTAENYAPYGVNKTIPDMFVPDEIITEFAELKTIIEAETQNWMATFAMGVTDLDSDWDTYVETLNQYGLERYLELYQQIYDVNHQ